MTSTIKKILVVGIWIALWALAAAAINSPIILPNPLEVCQSAVENFAKPNFWISVVLTFVHIGAGLLAACIAGCVFAFLSWRFSLFRDFITPAMHFVKSAPIVCFIVLVLVWVGSVYVDIIAVFFAVLPAYYFAMFEAYEQRNKQLLEMLRLFGVTPLQRFCAYEWPSMQPFFRQATKTGVGMSWKAGVTAELIGVTYHSIGEAVYMSKISLDTAGLFLWMFVVIVLGWLSEKLVLVAVDALGSLARSYVLSALEKGTPRKASSRRLSSSKENAAETNQSGQKDTSAQTARSLQPRPLSVTSLSKRFGDHTVVQNFTHTFEPGSRSVFMQSTGSGKTTLINMLMGLLAPDSGTRPDYQPPFTFSTEFQETRLLPSLNVEQNIMLAAGVSRERAREGLAKVIDPLFFDAAVDELSGGMKRSVELWRALAAQSECVVLDEPFTGMDEQTKQRAYQLVEAELGPRSLILITHDKADALALNCTEISLE